MHVKGGGGTGWRRWLIEAAGWVVLAGLIGMLVWFRASNMPAPATQPADRQTTEISVYFTHPEAAQSTGAGPAEALIRALQQAKQTIDMAAYELELAPIAEALIEARQRGVRVRIVAESDEASQGELPRLEAAGVPVVLDRRPSLMHGKFTVIDGQEVWTGSMNYTSNGVLRNNNNLLRLRSEEAASRFSQEFDEMFVEDRFSAMSIASRDSGPLSLGSATVEILFSPDDHPAMRIVEAIQAASSRVDFLAYSFTSDDIAQALVRRQQAGVTVRGVLEAGQAQRSGSQYSALIAGGVDVRLDTNPGLLHHKLMVIDGTTVITGSYNFSQSAETTNDENVVILHSAEVAQAFEDEVDRLYTNGLP
jgi:phosphatidylserine/phosphatidylglycerophosphate/cardiolipin synthase-like enzyme